MFTKIFFFSNFSFLLCHISCTAAQQEKSFSKETQCETVALKNQLWRITAGVPHEPYLRLWLYSLLDSAAYLEWWPSVGAKVMVGLFVEAWVKFRSRALNKGKGFEAWPCGKVTTRNKITPLWVRHTQLMNKKEKGVEERVDILLGLLGIGVCLPESLVTYICLLPVALLEPEDLKKIINNLVGGHRW